MRVKWSRPDLIQSLWTFEYRIEASSSPEPGRRLPMLGERCKTRQGADKLGLSEHSMILGERSAGKILIVFLDFFV